MFRLLLTIFICSYSSFAKETPVNIYIADLPPWINIDEDRCESGVLCDVFYKFNEDPKLKINYEVLSLGRANQNAINGKQDIAFFPKSDNLKNSYIEVGKLVDYKLGYYSLSKNSDGKICTISTSPHNEEGIDYERVTKLEQCFKMLLHNRVAKVLLTDIELNLLRKKFNKINVGKFEVLKNMSIWFYINRKLPKDLQETLKSRFSKITKLEKK